MPRFVRLPCILVLIALAATPRDGHAQDVADRRAIEAYRDSLAGTRDTVALKSLERAMMARARADRNDALLHLRLGFLSLRLGELAGRHHFENAGSEFQWVVDLQPTWPYGWFGLGLAEMGVGDAEIALVQGLRTMLGRDALTRSANAFARSAEVDPEFVAGLVELANTALRQRINDRLDVALRALRRSASTPAATNPAVLLARGRIERDVGSLDSAAAALGTLLARMPRHGEALLELARVRFAMNRLDGVGPWYQGLGVGDADATAAYRADLIAIMPDSVMRQFDLALLPDRVELVRRFWATRDDDELHRPGERLREHYRRLDYARRNYRLVTKNRQFDIAERFRSGQSEFDDRGIIYIRHGAPHDRASFGAPGIEPNETWKYRRDEGNLVFHFVARQDVQDYRLVESLYDVLGFATAVTLRNGADTLNQSDAVVALLRSRERIDPVYQRLMAAGRGGAGAIQTDERRLGRRSIAIGTSTDGWTLQFDQPLVARIETIAVGHDSVSPRLQVAFAVRGDGLTATRTERGFMYPVRLRASVLGPDGAVVARLDTTRAFVTRSEVPSREHLLGHATMRVPPGRYTVRVALETDDAGTVTTRDTVIVAGTAGPEIGLSDLSIGARTVPLPWVTASGDTAWSNPLASFARQAPMLLYFEVAGLAPGTSFRTDISVRRPSGGSVFRRVFGGGGAAIRLGFDAAHPGGILPLAREVSLAELKPGDYQIEVAVTTRDGRRSVRRREFTVSP